MLPCKADALDTSNTIAILSSVVESICCWVSNIGKMFNCHINKAYTSTKKGDGRKEKRKRIRKIDWGTSSEDSRIRFCFLKEWELGPSFNKWVSILYSEQIAKIWLEGLLLQEVVRQGCPLSPLLFNIALETLAVATRGKY